MQATGSDQDKPLGSRAVFSLQGGLSIHTLLSICLLHTSVHISPSVSFLCLWFHFGSPLSSSPGWHIGRAMQSKRSKFGDFLVRLSLGSLWKLLRAPHHLQLHHPPTHLFLIYIWGLSSVQETEAGGGGPETSIPYGFLPLQIKTLFRMQAFLKHFYCRCPLLSVKNRPATDEFDFYLTRTVKPVCWQCNYADAFFSDN